MIALGFCNIFGPTPSKMSILGPRLQKSTIINDLFYLEDRWTKNVTRTTNMDRNCKNQLYLWNKNLIYPPPQVLIKTHLNPLCACFQIFGSIPTSCIFLSSQLFSNSSHPVYIQEKLYKNGNKI